MDPWSRYRHGGSSKGFHPIASHSNRRWKFVKRQHNTTATYNGLPSYSHASPQNTGFPTTYSNHQTTEFGSESTSSRSSETRRRDSFESDYHGQSIGVTCTDLPRVVSSLPGYRDEHIRVTCNHSQGVGKQGYGIARRERGSDFTDPQPHSSRSVQWKEAVVDEPRQHAGYKSPGKQGRWGGGDKSERTVVFARRRVQTSDAYANVESRQVTISSHSRGLQRNVHEAAASGRNYVDTPQPTSTRFASSQAPSSSSTSSPSSHTPNSHQKNHTTDRTRNTPLSVMGIKVLAIDCEMVGCLEVNLPQTHSKAYLDPTAPIDHVLHKTQMKPTSRKKKKKPMVREISVAGRCSIVDYEGAVVYDSFINPHLKILSLRTPFSGIRKQDLKGAPRFYDARAEILKLLEGCVIVGHAIKNDLEALELTLPAARVRDTSLYKPLRRMACLSEVQPASLKKLALILLGKRIQKSKRGHCSLEDAQTTMDLYKVVEVEWESSLTSTV